MFSYLQIFFSSQRKRFRPDGVIKMGPQAKVPYETNNVDEPPKEKQISEAELQLKSMVQKQLATNITLERFHFHLIFYRTISH